METSSNELKSVQELYDLQSKLEKALLQDRWMPKDKERISAELSELKKLIAFTEKKHLDEEVMGGPEVMQQIEIVREQAELRLAGDKKWKEIPAIRLAETEAHSDMAA